MEVYENVMLSSYSIVLGRVDLCLTNFKFLYRIFVFAELFYEADGYQS